MCCIFTCVGWMIDLIQRVWVFAMTCLIFTAVCCAFITTSMSGVALGYNYSLAEYMELKETNVSVYMKRGVFDDSAATGDIESRRNMESGRRSGGQGDTDQVAPNEIPKPRKFDESMISSGDANKFEGQLMRLTANSLFETTPTTTPVPEDKYPEKIFDQPKSINQLKTVQAQINRKKSLAFRDPRLKLMSTMLPETHSQFPGLEDLRRRLEVHPQQDVRENEIIPPILASSFKPQDNTKLWKQAIMAEDMRRMNDNRPFVLRDEYSEPTRPVNPLRLAVPDQYIGNPIRWHKEAYDFHKKIADPRFDVEFEVPSPVTPASGIVRPTMSTVAIRATLPSRTTPVADVRIVEVTKPESKPEEAEKYKEEVMFDAMEPKAESDSEKKRDPNKSDKSEKSDLDIDYYDDDIKGLPVKRRRRGVFNKKKQLNHDLNVTATTKLMKTETGDIANKITTEPNTFLNKLLLRGKL